MSSSPSNYPPWYLHPFFFFVIGNQLTAWTAGNTTPQSTLRPAGLVLLLALSCYQFYWFPTYVDSIAWPARAFGGTIFVMPLIFFDRLMLRGWAFGDGYPGPKDQPKKLKDADGDRALGPGDEALKTPAPVTRSQFGQDVNSFSRGVGTVWEVKGVPHFSATDPTYVPSRVDFVCRGSLSAVACYVVHLFVIDALVKYKESPYVSPGHVPFLSRLDSVSIDEIYFRTVNSFLFWLWNYTMMEGFYALSAVIGVCLNANDIKLWRPLFGSPADSYTVRAFWGKSWHQGVRNQLEGPARFLTFSVLHLPKGTLLARYSNIFFAFLISGIVHLGADSPGALGREGSGSLPFYCAQALGIMLEDLVQELYRRARGAEASRSQTPIWAKVVGYVWVIAFLAWSTPAWAYPIIRTINREEAVISVSAFRPILPTLPFWR